MDSRDLLRIGVLLIGISSILVAAAAVHFYFNVVLRQASSIETEPFYAHCELGVVIIKARSQLSDVRVINSNGSVICSFEDIPKGSDETCRVGRDGVYLVEVKDRKRAVVCRTPPEITPPIIVTVSPTRGG